MKKKNGFTLLEIIIVVALMLVILTITLAIYGQNSRILSEVNVKSTLQTESQDISQNVSNAAMESSGIIKLILSDGTIGLGKDTEKKYSELKLVASNGEEDTKELKNNQWINIKEITINDKYEKREDKKNDDGTTTTEILDSPFNMKYVKNKGNIEESNKAKGDLIITKDKFDNTETVVGNSTTTISNNVDCVLIKPSNLFSGTDASGNPIKVASGKISDATSIELNINLSKKKGRDVIKYSVPITVTFRNKVI